MTLADLLAPLSIEDFVETYSERRCLHVPGRPERAARLFDSTRLLAILGRTAGGDATFRRKQRFALCDGEHREMAISPDQVQSVVAAGMTVMVDGLDRHDRGLRALVDDTRRTLGIPEPVEIAAFVSPEGSGFGLHYDCVPNWVIQIEGRKRWRYSELPAVSHPDRTFVPDARQRADRIHDLDESSLLSVDLAPGDVLYIPPGAWHEPTSLDGVSLHLSMVARPVHLFALFERAVTPLLGVDWRRLPWAVQGGIEDELARRREQLLQALDEVSPRTLYETWAAELPGPPPAADTKIAPTSRLRRTRDIRHAVERRGDGEKLLVIADSRVIGSLPVQARPFVERVAALDEFTAEDACSWGSYEWDSIQSVLAGLVSLGLLSIVQNEVESTDELDSPRPVHEAVT